MTRRSRPLLFALVPLLAPVTLAQTVVYEEVYDTNNSDELLGIDDVEITPNGRYAVARDNTDITSARIYDLLNPGPPVVINPGGMMLNNNTACQDGVAVTDERAVVVGSEIMIIDLTQPSFPVLFAEELGIAPRDVAITPDGAFAIVRGGDGVGGGTAVYDLASATLLQQQPGDIGDFFDPTLDPSVDTVVADNAHAVSLSLVGTTTAPATRITVWDLRPAGGGPPIVAFETGPGTDLDGEPHDLALSPDGLHAAVRSVNAVARVELAQAASGIQWTTGLWNDPGALGESAMDSIAMTNDAIVSISRRNGPQGGMQVDLWDAVGNQSFHVNTGDPHDLAITPDGRLAAVRTSFNVQLFDLLALPATSGTMIAPVDINVFAANTLSFMAGLDSLELTNTRVVAMANLNPGTTRVRTWDISANTLETEFTRNLASLPLDLTITPDESKIVAVGIEDFLVIEMLTGKVLLDEPIDIANGGFSWCDGVVANNDTAFVFGTELGSQFVFGGWLTQVDLFNQPARYCGTTVNSTGAAARIAATGSANESTNNLRLVVSDLPGGEFGAYFYGDMAQSTPFGNGELCVGGQVAAFPVQVPGAAGNAVLEIDNVSLPAGGGALTAGSSWNFQYLYRDSAATTGATFNTSDALTILFE